ncbi:MAG TPA: VIT1/CCC1 transporter family protein [Candidatus Limnocylindrales bacterium]|nr:VIT1/CCC1 transporter family protein [Candidatus Limnocylindrales bacterium]
MATIDIQTSLENLKLERDAIILYDALAGIEKDERRSTAFRTIAGNERRHADVWASKLRELGATVPQVGGPRLRVRTIIVLARVFGTRSVSDLVQALEGDEEVAYSGQLSPEVEAIAADEREHAQIWKRLAVDAPDPVAAGPVHGAPGAEPATPGSDPAVLREVRAPRASGEIGRSERWHRTGQSGTLRAIIFGVSDGLVSNTSLVMGISGASTDPHFILLAGIAGLLAGSFSMAAGEYISMQSQRELYERQIALERAEMEAMPDEEQAELAAIYRTKGFTEEEATRVAARLFRDPKVALDTLIREELGLDPDQLGSPWGAAFGSLVAFAAGAAVPVLPYLVGSGAVAFGVSIVLSLAAMFVVGIAISLLTGRSALFSGARQVGIGALAAAVTFLVGKLIGVAVA